MKRTFRENDLVTEALTDEAGHSDSIVMYYYDSYLLFRVT